MGSHTQVKEVPFNTAVAFLDGLEAFNSEYGPPDYRSPWVFRGHIDAAWELRPSAWRDDGMKKLEPLKKWLEPQVKAYALSNGVGERKLERCVQQAAEVFAVRQFCDLADDLGLLIDHAHEVPDRGSAIENAVGRYLPNGRIDTDHVTFVDMPFAFAQHHGIPTRYMDWTRDPHVAAYFAVNGAIGAAGKSTDRVCVFAIKRDGVARKGIKWIVVPRSQHHYLHA